METREQAVQKLHADLGHEGDAKDCVRCNNLAMTLGWADHGQGLICECCGQPGARTVIDPYDADVNSTEIEVDLCETCEQTRRDDI